MEPIVIFLIWLAGTTVLEEPGNKVVLLEESDGSVGRIIVSNNAGSQNMNRPNTVVSVNDRNSLPEAPQKISQQDIRAVFGNVLDIAPLPPERFLFYFNSATADLTDESRADIARIITAFKGREMPRATIIGHTDRVGQTGANFRLGFQRAEKVRKILVDAGMDPNQTVVRSHGENDPIFDTADEVDEPKNRRVEIMIW
ncbi:MAG: OmpA family protein [Rhodospirillaceae bacterium]|nr:OmpA family protein [Rhodospirillaceae bacterium]